MDPRPAPKRRPDPDLPDQAPEPREPETRPEGKIREPDEPPPDSLPPRDDEGPIET